MKACKTTELNAYKTLLMFVGVVVLTAFLGGCYYDNAEELYPSEEGCDSSIEYSYADDVAPIISGSCSLDGSCHPAAPRVDLSTYDGMKHAIENEQLRERIESGNMPQGSTLAESDKCAILGWIDANYPNN